MAAAALSTTLQTFDRQAVESAIERLIGLLDRFDIDPDYEPSLSWMNTFDQRFISDDLTGSLDLEFDVADARHDAGGAGDDWGSTVNTAFMDQHQAVAS